MLLATSVVPAMREKIAAVVHVDGTARVQTVHKETNPRLHALIEAFARLTGVPVLLNTSFNVRGEPIVETPGDAVNSYLGTDLDALVVHDWLLRKRAAARGLRSILRPWIAIRRGMSSSSLSQAAARHILDHSSS